MFSQGNQNTPVRVVSPKRFQTRCHHLRSRWMGRRQRQERYLPAAVSFLFIYELLKCRLDQELRTHVETERLEFTDIVIAGRAVFERRRTAVAYRRQGCLRRNPWYAYKGL